jgi:serine O-acetyltransferase
MAQQSGFSQSLKALKNTFTELHEDIDRYVYTDQIHWIVALLLKQGLWVTTQYRLSRWVHYHFHVPLLRPIVKTICSMWQKIIEILTGVELPNRAEIAGGLYLPHANGIIVHIDAKIGRYCNIAQQVTIGVGGRGNSRGTPVLGERVFIGPGARLFGPIAIGNDVAIGANAVVMKPLPDCAVAVGVPAQVMSHAGSQEFILYRGCVAHQVTAPANSQHVHVQPADQLPV